MPDAEIRETTITPDGGTAIVRLQIADTPLADEHMAAIRLMVAVRLPHYKTALLEQYQREAVRAAEKILHRLVDDLGSDIQEWTPQLSPTVKR